MNALLTNEVLQGLAWFAGLLELVLALYVLFLNARHTANRHVSLLLFISAVNSLALGALFGVTQAAQAVVPTLFLAATTEPFMVASIVVVIVLLRPRWLQGRWRWLLWLLYGLLFLPMVLTVIDSIWHTGLWYGGIDAVSYSGGYIETGLYETGSVAQVLRRVYLYFLSILPLVPVVLAIVSRDTLRVARRLAWMLLIVQVFAVGVQFGLRSTLGSGATSIISTTLYAMAYAYTAFRQMISERRAQRGRLRSRLVGLTLIIALPILVALVAFVQIQSLEVMEVQAFEKLEATSNLLAINVQLWLDFNSRALQQLVALPQIRSMDPEEQRPILQVLDQISHDIATTRFGETGISYVVDAQDQIVVYPDAAITSQILNIHDSPIIQKMRVDKAREFDFVDADGVRWQVYAQVLSNGWGVIVQQEWDELHRPLLDIGGAGAVASVAGAILLGALMFFTMRQAFEPIDELTATAAAIAEGDLTRVVSVVSEDELGVLARTFNSMTAQLRESIDTLEHGVAERTADLEQRSAYLQASAEVSRAAASILDPDALIQQVVELIRERFDLYYTGLFLLDETRTWAVLRSGTGTAGQAMLARHHRIRVGEGMIGWSITQAEARVASRVEVDEVRVTNPELPDTRSEAALPLRSRGEVLGALSVQSARPDAFDAATLTVLQTLVDQVAIAIDNARLLTQARESLEAERRASGLQMRQDWDLLARTRAITGYVGARTLANTTAPDAKQEIALFPAQGEWSPEMYAARRTRQSVRGHADGMPTLAVPILVRNQVVGVLNFSKSQDATGPSADMNWTRDEVGLLEALAEQMGQALESARLYRQTQLRAAREGAIREISDQMQRATDMSALMRVTTEALNKALGGSRVYVRWGTQTQAAEETGRPDDGQPDYRQPDGGNNGEAE